MTSPAARYLAFFTLPLDPRVWSKARGPVKVTINGPFWPVLEGVRFRWRFAHVCQQHNCEG